MVPGAGISFKAIVICSFLAASACGGSSQNNDGDGGGSGDGGGGGDGAAPSTSPNGCADVGGSCATGPICTDYAGFDAANLAAYQAACTAGATNTWSSTACNTTGSVGGCKLMAPTNCTVFWDFPPLTVSSSMANCSSGTNWMTWVTP
jgi:hypothetical protein